MMVEDRGRMMRKRPSRWGGEAKFSIPSTLKAEELSSDQIALYALHMRIEEIGRQLRTNDYVPPSPERSPSPEPFYGADGKRINTREYRFRKKLEDERHKVVSMTLKLDPNYRPPADYKKPTKLAEKIYIPVKEFPEINFIGLLLGPRGTTLKQMENDSQAKIAIRGKGSVKEGKGAPTSYQNQEEDLHCLITADNEEKIKSAVVMVNRIIETASTIPEAQNELKRKQLRDLAALNGTLRDDENQVCQNCGAMGHKRFNCPERSNVTNNIICRICGGTGHMARDCMARNNPEALQEARERESRLDSEYQSLMAELGAADSKAGSNPAAPSNTPWSRSSEDRPRGGKLSFAQSNPSGNSHSSGGSIPPWASAASSHSSSKPPAASNAPPPWATNSSSSAATGGHTAHNVAEPSTHSAYPQSGNVDPSGGMDAYAAYYQYYYQQFAQMQQMGASGQPMDPNAPQAPY